MFAHMNRVNPLNSPEGRIVWGLMWRLEGLGKLFWYRVNFVSGWGLIYAWVHDNYVNKKVTNFSNKQIPHIIVSEQPTQKPEMSTNISEVQRVACGIILPNNPKLMSDQLFLKLKCKLNRMKELFQSFAIFRHWDKYIQSELPCSEVF